MPDTPTTPNLDDTTANMNDNFKRAQHLNVEKLCLIPNSPEASKNFSLWKRKLDIYTKALGINDDEKFDVLINKLDITKQKTDGE